MSRPRAATAAVLLLGGLGACTGGGGSSGAEPTGRLVPATPGALAAVVATHLSADLEGVHVDPRHRERRADCPGWRRLHLEVDLRGADVHVDLVAGECAAADLVEHRCGPDAGGALRRCTSTRLDDGSTVDAGLSVVREEGRYRTAVRRGDGWRVLASSRTDQDVDVPLAELVAAVSDPALGPRVDAAWARAGRALPTGGER